MDEMKIEPALLEILQSLKSFDLESIDLTLAVTINLNEDFLSELRETGFKELIDAGVEQLDSSLTEPGIAVLSVISGRIHPMAFDRVTNLDYVSMIQLERIHKMQEGT